jgi:flagellar biosynthetic protein FliP
MTATPNRPIVRPVLVLLSMAAAVLLGLLLPARPASAAPTPSPVSRSAPGTAPTGTGTATSPGPVVPTPPRTPSGVPAVPADSQVNVNLGTKPSSSIVAILALTLLAVAPALLLLCTSFTKIIVVLSLTRNALGLTSVPPNQVLAGLALFLTMFVMSPVLTQVNHDGVQPYLKGTKTQSQAFHDGMEPLRAFMSEHTRSDEVELLVKVSKQPQPKTREDVPLTTLVPAFVLSELRSAFIIGFVIFIPFLVIDLVVSSSLMSMGMMMLPPVMISLPFKLLLFLLVDGWALVVKSLVASYG